MNGYQAPLSDVTSSLVDVLDYPAHYRSLDSSAELDAGTISSILEAVAKFAEAEIAPLNGPADAEGAICEAGSVRTPAGFADAYRKYVDAGWPGLAQPTRYGGQGLPYSLQLVASEFLQGASQAWCMYTMLNDGAIKTLLSAARPAQIDAFVPRLVSGEWTATMCLTEAHAGSDLGLLSTRAEPVGDPGEGRFRITGNKIFISSGDHDFADNIVHLVLARLPDAPLGVRGISLFVVPKRKLDEQGNAAGENCVSCVSIEHKMGLRGSATCAMAFDGAEGWLVGEPHRGLAAMFIFINKSRVGVAVQAVAQAQAAHTQCVAYARDRLQGRVVPPARPDLPADPLIEHADVRRMLLTQKAIAEGGRSFLHWCASWIDVADMASDKSRREEAQRMLGVLTPIAKAFLSELAFESVDLSIQVLGGHGYMREWGLEQRLRDVRITRIYEGTSGIQGFDLLGRKVFADSRALVTLFHEIESWCSSSTSSAARFVEPLRAALETWRAVTAIAVERETDTPGFVTAVAYDYVMLAGYVMVGWMWARQVKAIPQHRSKQDAADYFFEVLLPRLETHATIVKSGLTAVRKVDSAMF
ncbi:acyl-CoA dehydrogenase [Burkholderia vietnamiensis]|uniref:Acyl-CoA dehydrogenase n=1 Tax=Burkholderia vietnamiensis TaxID=60552 RepID=A0AAW7SYT0_BURVI|nr:acyl-CoA dehydrogenase [Burkholderia vietnamiensis]MBH9645858.1 acyl-CoA dehydrogenase [Burkholderia vietnamiensis]MBR8008833.1 acyl-CoA dehydrogenase [Burkholderia vietnamiensis]MDN7551308.1 acyl-CoA dehydrogenase [Burkholderia vietnamiensis]MDN7795122.1 acyl-CoA dehydrogenase [Burkholderia vietnamiensis]MDN8044970.1 acyl-CoA dehydrogenase [Burkholderia vietnamiensis]